MKRASYLIIALLTGLTLTAQEMRSYADSLRKYRSVPGLVYAVFNTERILDSGTSGVRKLRLREPIRWEHRFMIGSATTAFTAYIAARLTEEKKIAWNTSIGSVFPELNGRIMKLYQKITLEQLLAQRAGLPPYEEFSEYKDIHSLPGSPVQQRAHFVEMMLKRKPALVLDSSQFVYSVAGTAIAAAMLERVTRKSWEQLVDQYINKPLSIQAGFGPPALKDSTQPWGHWDTYFTLTAHIDEYWARSFTPIAPAGNLTIGMDDLIVFLRDHLLALQGQKSVLGTDAANHLLFRTNNYSTGWFDTNWMGYDIAFLPGRGGLFSSYIEIIREKNLAIVVLCNSGTVNGRSAAVNLGRQLRQHYLAQ